MRNQLDLLYTITHLRTQLEYEFIKSSKILIGKTDGCQAKSTVINNVKSKS